MFEPIKITEQEQYIQSLETLTVEENDNLPTPDNPPELTSSTLYSGNGDENETIVNFEIKSVIGRGNFGKVFLVQKRYTQEVFAMKQMRKDQLLEKQLVESTLLEKEILQKANHPFLVNMNYVFQT